MVHDLTQQPFSGPLSLEVGFSDVLELILLGAI